MPLHNAPMGRRLGYSEGALPVTEDVAARLVRLPMYYELAEGDIRAVVDAVCGFFGVGGSE